MTDKTMGRRVIVYALILLLATVVSMSIMRLPAARSTDEPADTGQSRPGTRVQPGHSRCADETGDRSSPRPSHTETEMNAAGAPAAAGDSRADTLFHDLLESESTLNAAGLGGESRRFRWNRREFYRRATPEQKEKGRQLLMELRSAMNVPANLRFEALFFTEGAERPGHRCECFFKSPGYYAEEATGALDYRYVTDGTFEITDYAADIVERSPGLVLRDVDKDIFLEVYPARIMLDTDLVWRGARAADGAGGDRAQVIGNWLYDMSIRPGDHLVEDITFFTRADRSKALVRIYDIIYRAFETADRETGRVQQHMLPVEYKIAYGGAGQGQASTVKLEYESLDEEIPPSHFEMRLKDARP